MLVKDIVNKASEILELKNACEYLKSILDEPSEKIQNGVKDELNLLINAVNLVNVKIATNYIELIDVSRISNVSDVLPYLTITSKNIIDIKSVRKNGLKVPFRVSPMGLITEKGALEIEYAYYPEDVDVTDDIRYDKGVNLTTFATGVVAEYLYIKGDAEEGYIWENKFKNYMDGATRQRRNITLKSRRWE